MIQMYTYIDVADNSGAKECMCVKVLGGTRKRYAGLVMSSSPASRRPIRAVM